jgi:hypothetical protein
VSGILTLDSENDTIREAINFDVDHLNPNPIPNPNVYHDIVDIDRDCDDINSDRYINMGSALSLSYSGINQEGSNLIKDLDRLANPNPIPIPKPIVLKSILKKPSSISILSLNSNSTSTANNLSASEKDVNPNPNPNPKRSVGFNLPTTKFSVAKTIADDFSMALSNALQNLIINP